MITLSNNRAIFERQNCPTRAIFLDSIPRLELSPWMSQQLCRASTQRLAAVST